MESTICSNIHIIAVFLDLQDILELRKVSKLMNIATSYESIWSDLLNIFNFSGEAIIEKKPENLTSYEYFKEVYAYYKEIKNVLLAICKKLDYHQYFKNDSCNFLRLNKRKLEKIKQIISTNYKSINLSYFFLYYILNGQNSLKYLQNYSNSKAFFGGFSYYYDYYEFYYLPFETKIFGFLNNFKFHALAKENHNFFLLIDFENFFGYGNETIFSPLYKELKSHNFYRVFIVEKSLLRYLRKISLKNYEADQEREYIDHFDTINNPDSDVTTQGIRVRAKAIYNPWDTRDVNKFFFPYQIRISDNGVERPYKLHSRKWVIRDGIKKEYIDGIGVIGKNPVISPGCQDFVYESVSTIESFDGDMEGSFFFESRDEKQDVIEVKVGKFKFQLEAGTHLLMANFETKEIKKIME